MFYKHVQKLINVRVKLIYVHMLFSCIFVIALIKLNATSLALITLTKETTLLELCYKCLAYKFLKNLFDYPLKNIHRG